MPSANLMVCSICNKPMAPVHLNEVPIENIEGYVSVPGNELEDNWYWCSTCDSFDQAKTPIKVLSKEEAKIQELMNEHLSNWWL